MKQAEILEEKREGRRGIPKDNVPNPSGICQIFIGKCYIQRRVQNTIKNDDDN